MIKVYLSGPITAGDRNWNQYQANVTHKLLLQHNFAVYNPMPTGTLPFSWDGDITHERWLQSDKEWVKCSDVVVRLPGESKGGDEEVAFAQSLGIPVIFVARGNYKSIPCRIDEVMNGV